MNFKISKFAYSAIEFSYKSRRSVKLYFTTVYWVDENNHSSKKSLRVQLSILRTAFRVLRDSALFVARGPVFRVRGGGEFSKPREMGVFF